MLWAVFTILFIEVSGATLNIPGISTLSAIGLLRLLEIGSLLAIVLLIEGNLCSVGVHAATIFSGIRKGVLWSMAFGLVVAVLALALLALGKNPLLFVKMELPDHPRTILLLFVVGGVIAPVAEEFFFRGIIFTFFRRWGFWFALCLTSIIFACLHLASSGIPVVQLVGGVLFAAAFEIEKNLLAPMVIHIMGNLAIFSISHILF